MVWLVGTSDKTWDDISAFQKEQNRGLEVNLILSDNIDDWKLINDYDQIEL